MLATNLSRLGLQPVEPATTAGGAFKTLASPFLHPFNLDMNLAKQNIEWIKARHKRDVAKSKSK